MARCSVCGKKNRVGNSRSHSNIASKRRFGANIQDKRDENGKRIKICTRCIKSQNKVS